MENGGEAEITKADGRSVFGNIHGFPACQHVWGLDGNLSGIPECNLVERLRDLHKKPTLLHPRSIVLSGDFDYHYCHPDFTREKSY